MGLKWGSPRQCGWPAGQGSASHLSLIPAGTAGSQRHGPTQGHRRKERHRYTITAGNQSLHFKAETYICYASYDKRRDWQTQASQIGSCDTVSGNSKKR